MTRILSIAAFVLGAAIVVWMGFSFMGSNILAFVVTGVIGIVYVIGFVELMKFQRDSNTLENALKTVDESVTDLNAWLSRLSPSLQSSVRLRIQGEHTSLPVPMLTPYLVGLLVMLGLLGTFAGMVATLKGAVYALEGTTELEAIRAGLAAPIKGLSLAFGTSVAGVSASAMLGFISTLSRRQRLLSSRLLDGKMATVFQNFSLAYNRDQTFKAMQEQAQSLPLVAERLTTVAERLENFSRDVSQQLLDNQGKFHVELSRTYVSLADSVDTSLKQSVNDSSHLLSENLQSSVKSFHESIQGLEPLMANMVNNVNQEMRQTHTHLTDNLQQQFGQLSQQITNSSKEVGVVWQQGVKEHQASNGAMVEKVGATLSSHADQFNNTCDELLARFGTASEQWIVQHQTQDQQRLSQWREALEKTAASVEQHTNQLSAEQQVHSQKMLEKVSTLMDSTEQLIEKRVETESSWLNRYETRMTELTNTVSEQLQMLRNNEAQRSEAALEQLKTLNGEVAEHLQTLGQGLEAPMTRLIETASETPKAAAEVISQLRAEMSNTVERDNQLLVERQHIFDRLTCVADALRESSTQQVDALQALVIESTDTLNGIGTRFNEQLDWSPCCSG